MRKRMKNVSFRRKIFMSMLLAAIAPMVVGYLVMLQVFNMTYKKNLNQEAETILNATAGSLDSAFSFISEALQQLGRKDSICNSLKTGGGSDPLVYRELYAVTSECGDYAYFTIYDSKGHKAVSVSENSYIRETLPLDWGLLYEAAAEPGKCVVRNARIYQGERRVEYLRIGMAVCDSYGNVIGYVVATVQNGNFDNMLKGIIRESQGTLYAMDDFHETVYSSADAYNDSELRLARQNLLNGAEDSEQVPYQSTDNKYFYYMYREDRYGLYLFYQQPIASLNGMKNSVMTIAILSGFLGIAICLILSGYLSRLVCQPIERMQAAITEIRNGNFKAKIRVETQDELGQLSESFNLMSDHLTENMNNLLLRERELNEAHIEMMQSQLNPHFLYNTLDTMKWLGKANQVPEVATLSAGLAKILRMSISARPRIRLCEEMELADAYVQIQKIRFADKFEYIVDVPEQFLNCFVPKLILQPLIENSIRHGFANRENGTVMVSASKTEIEGEDALQMIVQDDGEGMSPEQVAKLNACEVGNSQNRRKTNNIGYFNVNAIIRLNYGEAYGLRAESVCGKGTKVYITIPIREEESDV